MHIEATLHVKNFRNFSTELHLLFYFLFFFPFRSSSDKRSHELTRLSTRRVTRRNVPSFFIFPLIPLATAFLFHTKPLRWHLKFYWQKYPWDFSSRAHVKWLFLCKTRICFGWKTKKTSTKTISHSQENYFESWNGRLFCYPSFDF